jgi:RNA polymerase sigma-70 factor (ECF subfamily)
MATGREVDRAARCHIRLGWIVLDEEGNLPGARRERSTMTGSARNREDELAAEYTRIRPRLLRAAYALLGTHAEAEDAVADTWLRLAAADERDPVDDVEAWAVVAVSRRALDVLRSARIQREAYVGPWLPEPLIERLPGPAGPDGPAELADPADRVTLDESVSYALMVVLETLTPAERTAWVLHDLFGVPFTDIAGVVGRGPAAVRQLAARARAHVRAGAPRMAVSPAEHRDAVDAFFRAAAGGDLAGLVAVLDPDVVLTSDGGGQATAARRPVRGAGRVSRFLVATAATISAGQRVVPLTVNGGPGLAIVEPDGSASLLGALTVAGGRILRVDLVVAPAKLVGARFTPSPQG